MTVPPNPALRRSLTAGFWLALILIVAIKAARAFGVTGGLLGVLPNLGFAVALTLVFGRWASPVTAALSAFLAGAVNELTQLQTRPLFVLAGRAFDPLDLVASGVGAILGFGIVRWMRRRSGTDRSDVA